MLSASRTRSGRDPINDLSGALFAVAWIVGLAQSAHPAVFGFGHGFEMASIAKNLVERGTFGNPFDPAITGPTAVVPPLYPMFLAFLIRLFGWPLPAALIATIAFNAVTAGLLPRLALAFFRDTRPGLIAGCFWIAAMPMMPQWDVSFTIACLVLACVFASQSLARPAGLLWPAVAAGALGGIISLLNPLATLAFLPWIAFLIVSQRKSNGYAMRYGATVLLVIALCNLPWLVRNYRIWHAPVLRTNFGMTIYSSNNDCAQSGLGQNGAAGCYQQTHPIASDAEIHSLQQLGEVNYDRRRTADALAWIRSHRSRFTELTAARIREFWFPVGTLSNRPLWPIWAVTLLSAPGMLLMLRRRETVAWFVLSVWTLYPLAYYVVVSSDRYRYPILWTTLLPAGYCLAALAPAVQRRLFRTSPAR